MKYFILAGEKSGELHGANLMKSILAKDPQAEFKFFGGDQMKSVAGIDSIVHINQLDAFGFVDVIKQYPKLKGFLRQSNRLLKEYQPDAVILIDYSGFNMKVAKYAHKLGLKVHYYISPKIWVWNEKRAFKVKRYVDYMYCILPFEVDFYKKYDFKADYVGNPLLDEMEAFKADPDFISKNGLEDKKTIALLPGSRKMEIENILSLMGEIEPLFKDYQFVVAAVDNFDEAFYRQYLPENSSLKLLYNKTYDLLSVSEAAIVTSGTATLETALLKVPQVVVYKANNISYRIFKMLSNLEFVSLCNLILNKEVAVELIQHDFTLEKVVNNLKQVLKGGDRRDKNLELSQEVIETVGGSGASERVANFIIDRT
ncbi:lipid-A-disaccharide synthase [Cyclobacteriaceae bacterium]|nr:lipid-A-disaccharide synthase [Cyclobacteriaceae bacterium]